MSSQPTSVEFLTYGELPQTTTIAVLYHAAAAPIRVLQTLVAAPSLLFILTLGLMLFRPPNVNYFPYDRISFVALLLAIFFRACIHQDKIRPFERVSLPLLCLAFLSLYGVLTQPYSAETWSVFVARWLVPLALFHVAGLTFRSPRSLDRLELFLLFVLAYLTFTSLAFLFGANEFIFPRYILAEGLGIHADRARGPFLQAVANGLAINLLALIALNAYARGRLRGCTGILFCVSVPLAIVATKTRAVWLSAAGAVVALAFFGPTNRVRPLCRRLTMVAALVVIAGTILIPTYGSLSERLQERSPVDYRMAVYGAGWEMLLEKPLLGWGPAAIQNELWKRVSGFHVDAFYFHNTYLQIAVENGLVALAFYVWLIVDLIRIGRTNNAAEHCTGAFTDADFRSLWPVMLFVYFTNACFVGMNYQFVNGLLFSLAGILAAKNHSAEPYASPQ